MDVGLRRNERNLSRMSSGAWGRVRPQAFVLEDGQGIGCFGEYLPGDAVTKWSNGEWTQLAFEAEVLPIFFA